MNFEDFSNKWLIPSGQRIDYTHALTFDSIELIFQYLYECYQISNIDTSITPLTWWTNPPSVILTQFYKVENSDTLAGDIIVLDNHIGIATGNLNPTDIEIMEQNGETGDDSSQSGDAIRTRYIARERVIGILRPGIIQTIVSKPPALDAVSNLPYGAFTADSPAYLPIVKVLPSYNGPVAASNRDPKYRGEDVQPGTNYFLFTTKYGMHNVTLVSGMPGVWINPSDNTLEPEAEVTTGVSDEEKQRIKDSWADTNVFAPEEQEADWRTSYVPFMNKHGDVEARYYMAMQPVQVVDLEGIHKDANMKQYDVTPVGGTFVKDGVVYARPQSAIVHPVSGDARFWWYGIPMIDPDTGTVNLMLESEVFNADTELADRQATKNLTFHDYLVLLVAKAEGAWDKVTFKNSKHK